MDLDLGETQKLIRDTARSFAQKQLAPGARERDRQERFDVELYRQMGELGLLGVNVPARLGGAEAGAVAYSLAMTEVAAACASSSVGMGVTNMCAELITQFGTEAQQQKYVPPLVSGEAIVGAFALSEPHCGSDAAAMRTTARRAGNRYVLDGTKQWITSGAYAGVMVVWARTAPRVEGGAGGISAFIVERETQGLLVGKPEEKMGLRSSNTVSLTFEGCEVPAGNLLGGEGDGFKLAMAALDGGRIGIGSQACGVARAALESASSYAKQRVAFGKPIAELQAIRFHLANMATELSAAQLLTLRAADLKEKGQRFTLEASMAKLYASEMVQRVCDKAVQIHGGYGYIDEFPVERYLRDARVQTIYEGTSEIQRLVIARGIFRSA